VEDARPELLQGERLAVAQGTEGVGDGRALVQAQLPAGGGDQAPRPGDVVGVDVGVEHVAQGEPAALQEGQVRLDLD
jgi:hypothetical protein